MWTFDVKKFEPGKEECPICGFNYIHPVEVACLPAGREGGLISITADGIHRRPLAPPLGRGVFLTIVFRCEEGHMFRKTWQFHEGETLTNCEYLGWTTCGPNTIWRN